MQRNPQILTLPSVAPPSSMRTETLAGLRKPVGHRSLPTVLLYDERGLRLYDDITTDVPEYYLFGAEEEILKEKGDEIVGLLNECAGDQGSQRQVVIELGAGALRKTAHLLTSFSKLSEKPADRPRITYHALDLQKPELDRTLSLVQDHLGDTLAGKVDIKGLCGTYEDGIKFIEKGGLKELELDYADTFTTPPSSGDSVSHSSDLDSTSGSPSTQASTLPPATPPHAATMVPESPSPCKPVFTLDSPLPDTLPLENAPSPVAKEADHPPLHLLFLGSSLGNFTRSGASNFLRSLPLRPGSGDTLVLGLDGRKGMFVPGEEQHGPKDEEKRRVELAYNDPRLITKKFIMNGLTVAGRVLSTRNSEGETSEEKGKELFNQSKWDYVERFNEREGRHEAYYKSVVEQSVQLTEDESVLFEKDELVHIEYSYKYSEKDAYELFSASYLRPINRWTDSRGLYSLWVLQRPPFFFPYLQSPLPPIAIMSLNNVEDPSSVISPPATAPAGKNPFSVPTLAEWMEIWKLWDTITLGMIPKEMLMQKPIDLRHICLFYLGHIPAFLDIHLSRLLGEPHTEPEYFKDIFERGIDPHVSDPDQCHPHSEVPTADEDWPSLESILGFRDRARARLVSVYERFVPDKMSRKMGRVLWMCFEHEGLHAETLLYMLIQRAGTGALPPPGFPTPNWSLLAPRWDEEAATSAPATVTLGPATVSLGHDDFEAQDADFASGWNGVDEYEFGWDNEHPKRNVHVERFRINKRTISNGEYRTWIESLDTVAKKIPASWVHTPSGELQVRTLFGPVPFEVARHWPLMASYDEIDAYAKSKGGRIPTEAELRLFMDGQSAAVEGTGANIGFKNWHPIPPSLGGNGLKGHNGGVWEWTSTLLAKHDGFETSLLYPGYSSDFFDESHHVVLGGSYATIPRIAQRRSLRNFYQHDYPYAWVGARIVYDS